MAVSIESEKLLLFKQEDFPRGPFRKGGSSRRTRIAPNKNTQHFFHFLL